MKKETIISRLLYLIVTFALTVALGAATFAVEDDGNDDIVAQYKGSWILEVPAGTPITLYWEDMEWKYYDRSSSIYLHANAKTEYASGKVTYYGSVIAKDTCYSWCFDKTENTIETNSIKVTFDLCGGTMPPHMQGGYIEEFVDYSDSSIQSIWYEDDMSKSRFVLAGHPYVFSVSSGISHLTDMIILPIPERDGYHFSGWYTEPDGGTLIDGGVIVQQTEDHTLYAHWEKIAEFVIENGVLTKYNGPGGDVVVPEGVTIVGSSAFSSCSSLTSVIIPDGVTEIGDAAFSCCSSLKSVRIPGSVTKIGNYLFTCCSSLENVLIGNGTTSLGVRTFEDCTSLKSITIPDGVTSLHETFWGCTGLRSVTIPDSVTMISARTFGNYDNLSDIYFAGTKEQWDAIEIGNGNGCLTTAAIHFQQEFTYRIENGVLTKYNGPGGDVLIPDSESLAVISGGVTSIGVYAFADCESLSSVTIPDSVISIGDSAFYGCNSLTSVTISGSVTSIGEWAFSGCDSLTEVRYAGTNEQWDAIDIGNGNECLITATILFQKDDKNANDQTDSRSAGNPKADKAAEKPTHEDSATAKRETSRSLLTKIAIALIGIGMIVIAVIILTDRKDRALLAQEPAPRLCPHCGSPVIADALFCMKCGKRLPIDYYDDNQ